MSKPNSNKETCARMVKEQKFSPLLPLSILILPNSLTFVPSIEEVPCACQTKEKTSYIGEYQVVWWRLIIKDDNDDDDDDLVVQVRSRMRVRSQLGRCNQMFLVRVRVM